MSYYFAAQIKITNPHEYQKYINEVDQVFEMYNGKYLAVDDHPISLEGNWNYTRSVLIEFPTETDFNNWYYSKEYQEILKHRLKGAECDSILIKGNTI